MFVSLKGQLAKVGIFGLVLGGIVVDTARADVRDFPFTYEWRQSPKGMKEFEIKNRYTGKDNTFEQQFEVEYGVTDRFQIAPYLVFEREAGGKYKYHEFKLETRYQLGDYKPNKILPGLYLEYAKERGGPSELEGKLILTRYGKDGSNLSFNYIIERELENGAEFENEYSIGYARRLSRRVRGGGELIHNLTDGTVNAGPVVAFNIGQSIFATAGYAFALNDRDGNRPQVRLNLEYEF